MSQDVSPGDKRDKPRSASRNLASPRPSVPSASSPAGQAATPPIIPNIPPRTSFNSNTTAPAVTPRSLSTSFKPSSLSRDASRRPSTANKLTPKPSNDTLGAKRALSPPPANATSNLTAQLGSSPSPRPPPLSRGDSGASTPRRGGGATAGDSEFSNLADIPDEEKAKVLRRHLVSAEERGTTPRSSTPGEGEGASPASPVGDHGDSGVQGGGSGAAAAGTSGVSSRQEGEASSSNHEREDSEQFPIPYDAPGGDVTHDIYKWQHDHRPRPNRAASFSHVPLDRSAVLDPTLAHIKEPGGFRRNFVVNRAQEQGVEPPTVVRNVIDFLFLYGHFAGEDLGEDDDDETEEEEDEEAYAGMASSSYTEARAPLSPERLARPLLPSRGVSAAPSERAPLLARTGRSLSKTRHRRMKSGPASGTASVTQATLMLLKGFVGTGVLFMGKAFFNGGLLFSTVVLLFIAAISLFSFLLLTSTYLVVPGSFGDIGGALYGKYMRLTILASITVSQIGFVAAYTIFIAENLQAFVLAVSNCKTFIPTRYLIFAQLVVFLPLAMIRDLAKLSGTALVADAFILVGLVYIGGNEIGELAKYGLADVQMFNRNNFPLLIGTAVFAFEGIGLVIPITESMREPQKFPRVLSGVMFVVAALFAGFGFLGYAAYGKNIQTVVIVNLPQEDKFVQAVQFLYSVAILLSTPLQLFPAVRIMENGLFVRSGKHNPSVKWQKNVFRAGTVVFCSLLSWAGSKELDKFVSLIGSFACIPLCFIYPPMLHLKAVAKSRTARGADIIMIVFGVCVGAYTTVQTIRSLFESGGGGGTSFGKCEVPSGA